MAFSKPIKSHWHTPLEIHHPTGHGALLSDPFLMLWKGELDSLWFWPSHIAWRMNLDPNYQMPPKGLQLWLQSTLVLGIRWHRYPALHLHSDQGRQRALTNHALWLENRRSSQSFLPNDSGKKVQISMLTMRWRRLLGMERQRYPQRNTSAETPQASG